MSWRNRIVAYSEEPPANLTPNEANWRTHSADQAEALGDIMTDIGIVQNVIMNRTTGRLIDGHLRVAQALRNEQPTIPVTWVDLSEDEERMVLATLDPLATMAGTNAEALGSLLHQLSSDRPAIMNLLDNLAKTSGLFDEVPSLDELVDAYGEHDESVFWPEIRLKVEPAVHKRWLSVLAGMPGDSESEKITALLDNFEALESGA